MTEGDESSGMESYGYSGKMSISGRRSETVTHIPVPPGSDLIGHGGDVVKPPLDNLDLTTEISPHQLVILSIYTKRAMTCSNHCLNCAIKMLSYLLNAFSGLT